MAKVSFFKCLLKSNLDFKKAYRAYRAYDKIIELDLFDKEFYLKNYPEINEDPLIHYIFKGFSEGKFPSLYFDGDAYYNAYPNVATQNINPLVHYALYGLYEGKLTFPSPLSKYNKIISTNLVFLNNYSFVDGPLVSIIVLNRNGLVHLKRLFDDFGFKTNYDNFEVIVVDNDSSDGSVEYLESLMVDFSLRVIKNDVNVSFSEGNNQAVKEANGEYVLLLNNDLDPTYGWLNEMVGTMLNNENVGAVGAKLVFPFYYDEESKAKSLTIQHAGVIFSEERRFGFLYGPFHLNIFSHGIFNQTVNKTKKVCGVTAAAILIKKSVYEQLGGLDEDYFYGYEDVDFNMKLNKAGYDVYYCSSALLFHHESSTRIEEGDYSNRALNNIKIFNKKWDDYLFKKILEDKMNNRFFYTNKRLLISFLNNDFKNNKNDVHYLSEGFKHLKYHIDSVEDVSYDLEDGTDMVISFSLENSMKNINGRDNIFSVLILEESFKEEFLSNLEDYDIIITLSESTKDKINNYLNSDNIYYLNKNDFISSEDYGKEVMNIISKTYLD